MVAIEEAIPPAVLMIPDSCEETGNDGPPVDPFGTTIPRPYPFAGPADEEEAGFGPGIVWTDAAELGPGRRPDVRLDGK